MKLFVTGSEGFIGRALKARCQNLGIDFVGVDLSGPRRADIRKGVTDLIPEGATVVHLAAVSRDPECHADPCRAFDLNVNGTIHVAASARRKKCPQFIFASSEWVYGDVRFKNELQYEDQVIDTSKIKSIYALTKIVAEQCLRMTPAPMDVTILRFGIIYGPRTTNLSAVESIFNAVRDKDAVIVGALKTARRFIHIEDVVSGILASIGHEGYDIFNLTGNRLVSLDEIVTTSMYVLNRKVDVTESSAPPSVRNADNSKAKKVLAWLPKIDLEAGLCTLTR